MSTYWRLSALALVSAYCAASPAHAQFVDRPGSSRISIEAKDFGYFFDGLQWPKESNGNTIIFVCWEDNALTGYPKETEWVRTAIAGTWQKHSRVQVRGWQTCGDDNAGIRIIVVDAGPRVMKFGKELDRMKNGMVLNFTFKTWSQSCASTEAARESCIRSIGVHEFGHALGFAHEQDRADTPGECAEKEGTGTTGKNLKILTPYDPESVMNYCNSKYNNDGKLSAKDITSVQLKYGVPARP